MTERRMGDEELHKRKLSLFLNQQGGSRRDIPLAEFEALVRESGSRRSVLMREMRGKESSISVPGIGLITESGGRRFLYVPNMGKFTAIIYLIDFDTGALRHTEDVFLAGGQAPE